MNDRHAILTVATYRQTRGGEDGGGGGERIGHTDWSENTHTHAILVMDLKRGRDTHARWTSVMVK